MLERGGGGSKLALRFGTPGCGLSACFLRETPRWVSFHVGSGLLCLRPRTLEGVFQDGPGAPSGSASVQLAFRVAPPEIDEIQAELAAVGVDLMGPPRDILAWGHRAIFFRDTESNVIEIYAEV